MGSYRYHMEVEDYTEESQELTSLYAAWESTPTANQLANRPEDWRLYYQWSSAVANHRRQHGRLLISGGLAAYLGLDTDDCAPPVRLNSETLSRMAKKISESPYIEIQNGLGDSLGWFYCPGHDIHNAISKEDLDMLAQLAEWKKPVIGYYD